jgi:hypothetical protein
MISRLTLIGLLLIFQEGALGQNSYYVSPSGSDSHPGSAAKPFATIERARDTIRNLTAAQDVTVYLYSGRYELANTVVFNEQDSGRNGCRITYRAVRGERPVFSGGRLITDWAHEGAGIYRAAVPGTKFRQITVNGKRGIRAREPDNSGTPSQGDYYQLIRWEDRTKRLVVNASEIDNWARLTEVEMVIQRAWNQNRLRIKSFSVNGSEATVIPREPERTRALAFHTPPRSSDQAYHFENALELLDQPGEWYLDTGSQQLYYMPRAGEDMTTATVLVPELEVLFKIQGTVVKPVEHLVFQGLTFQDSSWTFPSIEGYVACQGDWHSTSDGSGYGGPDNGLTYLPYPAAVEVENAANLLFERNIFTNLSANGLALVANASDCDIVGNAFFEIGAGGVSVECRWDLAANCRNNKVRNNYLARVGQDYYGAGGISAGHTENILIEHNELEDMAHNAINLGWWGKRNGITALRDNTVRYNRIHKVMNLLIDGAGIYTLSRQPGTQIVENYIYDIARSKWAVVKTGSPVVSGIYLDEYSSLITVRNNVIDPVQPTGGRRIQEIMFHKARDNKIINHHGTSKEYGTCHNNTFTTDSTLDVPAVKANAGLERSYADIKDTMHGDPPLYKRSRSGVRDRAD